MGPEHSGTNLLFHQVSAHPAFCNFNQATVETFCFIRPWALLQPAGPDNYAMRVYLGKQGNLADLQRRIQPLVRRNRALSQDGMPLDYLNSPDAEHIWQERRYRVMLWSFFRISWEQLGKKRLLEKTPAHIRCTRQILDTFPRAKLLVCTRDLGEIIASHRKRFAREISLGKQPDAPGLRWLSHSTDDYIRYIQNIDKRIKKLEACDAEYLIVPYGDLSRQGDKTLEMVFNFLGEEVSAPKSKNQPTAIPKWDPLLGQPPQPNDVNISEYLDAGECQRVADAQKALPHYWH